MNITIYYQFLYADRKNLKTFGIKIYEFEVMRRGGCAQNVYRKSTYVHNNYQASRLAQVLGQSRRININKQEGELRTVVEGRNKGREILTDI